MQYNSLYRLIWRWHFYAAVFVIPFIMILSITGSIYLFKPQIDTFQEREWKGLVTEQKVTIDDQFMKMRKSYPLASFHHYRVPIYDDDAAVFHIGLADQSGMRDIYVAPDGRVLAAVDPEERISNVVAKIHSSLLIGSFGRYIVELAASWAIVMIVSGLYLWWPRHKRIAGVLWPRIRSGKHIFWRDLHAVTGFWVSGLALILLLSGLPWTQTWAGGFNMLRAEMGWVNQQTQDWRSVRSIVKQHIDVPSLHKEHDHREMLLSANKKQGSDSPRGISLQKLHNIAQDEHLHHPIIIEPNKIIQNNQKLSAQEWQISSQTQNRPLRKSIFVNGINGDIIGRSDFADRHIIDQFISYGIAWHEGQLFGWFNQFIGVLTALALILLCYSGIKMWWARRAINLIQYNNNFTESPPKITLYSKLLIVIIVFFVLSLPMIALSVLCILVLDNLIFKKLDSI